MSDTNEVKVTKRKNRKTTSKTEVKDCKLDDMKPILTPRIMKILWALKIVLERPADVVEWKFLSADSRSKFSQDLRRLLKERTEDETGRVLEAALKVLL